MKILSKNDIGKYAVWLYETIGFCKEDPNQLQLGYGKITKLIYELRAIDRFSMRKKELIAVEIDSGEVSNKKLSKIKFTGTLKQVQDIENNFYKLQNKYYADGVSLKEELECNINNLFINSIISI